MSARASSSSPEELAATNERGASIAARPARVSIKEEVSTLGRGSLISFALDLQVSEQGVLVLKGDCGVGLVVYTHGVVIPATASAQLEAT